MYEPGSLTRYKIQDILLSFCAYNYTHIRQNIQEHNIHKYPIQTQKLQILYTLNCFAVPDKHIQNTYETIHTKSIQKHNIYKIQTQPLYNVQTKQFYYVQ